MTAITWIGYGLVGLCWAVILWVAWQEVRDREAYERSWEEFYARLWRAGTIWKLK